MKKRLTIAQREPHVVKLPKGSKSPTNSIYKTFDIVKQEAVVSTFSDAGLTVRSRLPFTLSVQVGKKVRTIDSTPPKAKVE
jgi:hypothetical protein